MWKLCEQQRNSNRRAAVRPESHVLLLLRGRHCVTIYHWPYLGEAAAAFSPAKQTHSLLFVATPPVNRGKQSQTDMGSWSRGQRRSSKETPCRLGSTQSPHQPKESQDQQ